MRMFSKSSMFSIVWTTNQGSHLSGVLGFKMALNNKRVGLVRFEMMQIKDLVEN